MRTFLSLLAISLIIYITYSILKFNTGLSVKSYLLNGKINTYLANREKEIKQQKNTRNLLNKLSAINSLIIFKTSEKDDEKREHYAKRLSRKWNGVELNAEDYLTINNFFKLIYLIIVCTISVFNLRFLILVPLYTLVPTIVYFTYESDISESNKKILEDFYDFYSEFYYTYRHYENIGIPLAETAMSFYNRANSETRKMIMNLVTDSSASQYDALMQWKETYEMTYMQRLCDLLTSVTLGKRVSVESMDSFKFELETQNKMKLESNIAKVKEQIESLCTQCMIPLAEMVLYWAYISFLTANK